MSAFLLGREHGACAPVSPEPESQSDKTMWPCFAGRRPPSLIRILWACTGAALTATLHDSGRGFLAGAQKMPACNCGCCEVGYRRPAENLAGAADTKCIAKVDSVAVDDFEAACPFTCLLTLRSRVLKNTKTKEALYSQFCFLECRPFDIYSGSNCVEISKEEAMAARTRDGGGDDIHVVPVLQQPPTPQPPPAPPMELPGETEDDIINAPPPAAAADDGGGGDAGADAGPTEAEKLLAEAAAAKAGAAAAGAAMDADAAAAGASADKAEGDAIATRKFNEGLIQVHKHSEQGPRRVPGEALSHTWEGYES